MPTALIGFTGFVGGNLLAQHPFDELYNSRNIEQIAGRSFDLLVCSGARAEKWLANKQPEADRAGLAQLEACLERVTARELILISTVDVIRSPAGETEEAPIDPAELQPYGRHRYELEQFVRERFFTRVFRLPGLYGPGLKKNIIFDFLNDNRTDQIHHASRYQFYDVRRLWADVQVARRADLPLVHLATEPVTVGDVAHEAFDFTFSNAPPGPPASYDFRTRHAPLYGGSRGYIQNRDDVLGNLRQFVLSEARRAA